MTSRLEEEPAHHVLLFGEGNFSFALALAKASHEASQPVQLIATDVRQEETFPADPLPSVPTEATDLTDQTGIGKVVISIKGYVISIKGYACAHGCMPSTRTRAVARGRYATWTRTHASGCNACGAGSRRRPRCVRAASCVAL